MYLNYIFVTVGVALAFLMMTSSDPYPLLRPLTLPDERLRAPDVTDAITSRVALFAAKIPSISV